MEDLASLDGVVAVRWTSPEGELRLEEPPQGARARRAPARLGDRADRRRGAAGGGGGDLLRERAREGALRPHGRPARPLDDRRGLGLEVDGLGGRPGIYSARFAGPRRRTRRTWRSCSAELEGVTGPGRRARYVSELVALSPELKEVRGRGTLEGTIAVEPRGSEGFGYDPVFVPDGEQRTVAELGDELEGRPQPSGRRGEAAAGGSRQRRFGAVDSAHAALLARRQGDRARSRAALQGTSRGPSSSSSRR